MDTLFPAGGDECPCLCHKLPPNTVVHVVPCCGQMARPAPEPPEPPQEPRENE